MHGPKLSTRMTRFYVDTMPFIVFMVLTFDVHPSAIETQIGALSGFPILPGTLFTYFE